MKYFIIPLVIVIVAAFLTYVLELSITYGVFLAVIVFLISLLIVLYWYYIKDSTLTTSFLEKVYPSKEETEWEKEIELISEAKSNVKILGISHITRLSRPPLKGTLITAGEDGVEITFLILDPDGKNLVPKAEDEGADPKGWEKDIAGSIIQFEQIKRDHPTIDLELYTYDIFPIWHMAIIDDKIGLIGYYPKGRSGGESPLYLIKEEKRIIPE
jgi:hypothetical protein